MVNNKVRYEINHEGIMVEGETALSKDIKKLIKDLFSQNGWIYEEIESQGQYHKIKIINPMKEEFNINLFAANIRNEKRSPYEKKIQLSGKDPRKYKTEMTIILGFYVFDKQDNINEAIIVGYPIDENVHYDSNPSIRGVFVNEILLKAKVNGMYIDSRRKIIGFRPDLFFII